MPTYTIRVREENDPGPLAFLDAVEAGASEHTLQISRSYSAALQVDIIKHSRLGVTIERTEDPKPPKLDTFPDKNRPA